MIHEKQRLLVVEDDPDLAFGLRLNLEFEGYEVSAAQNGAGADEAFRSRRAQLVVLDLMLPDVDGMVLLERWRAVDADIPIVVLSARVNETTRVAAFRVGASDFVAKPFSLLELLERIKLQLRRTNQPTCVTIGNSFVDFRVRSVRRAGQVLSLTPKESELLYALVAANGAVLSKEMILRDVWHHQTELRTNTLEFHISALRRKLEDDPHNPTHLLTVRKSGYRLTR